MYPAAQKDPRGGHNRAHINQDFFKTWSSTMAYVLGLIYADGAVEDVQKSSRACYVLITSKDRCILEKVRHAMNSSHKFYIRLPQIHTFADGKSYMSHHTFNLRIGSKTMYNDLLKLGVTPRKSLTILFPKIPAFYLSFFIRGYFDGDGCLHLRQGKYPRVIFTSGSYQFLKSLSELLVNTLTIPSKIINTTIKRGGNPCHRLIFGTLSALKILQFMYDGLEKAPYLERKFLIYQKYLRLKQTAG